MKKLIDWWYGIMEGRYLSRIAHFESGFMIVVLANCFLRPDNALLVGAIAAIGKEIVDRRSGRGKPEVAAAIVTIAGALLAYFVLVRR